MLRKTIPVLTHVDNLSDMKIDMSAQEQSLERIANNTNSIYQEVIALGPNSFETKNSTAGIETAVGTTADESTSNTVIGLLKSIANKLS